MGEPNDLPPPIGSPAATPDPWSLHEQEPTNLLVLWPGAEAPSPSDVHQAFARATEHDLLTHDGPAADDPDVLWNILVEMADGQRLIVWSEAARQVATDELGDPNARACRWVVGGQALLETDDPLPSFVKLLRLLARAFPDAPAVLDANTTRWYRRPQLDELLDDDPVGPPADNLWLIHVVQAKPRDATAVTWLHTHGLWRCGRPELEMLDVPADEAAVAAELLSGIAELVLDNPPPPPGTPLEIGHDLRVTFQPLTKLIADLDPAAPGSAADRHNEAHGGVRAIVCDVSADGTPATGSRWPGAVARRLRRGEALLYRTGPATRRQARLARKTWPQLVEAFAQASKSPESRDDAGPWALLIKAPLGEPSDAEAPREHLWFAARRFEADRAEAALLNRPRSTTELEPSNLIWINRDGLSDWFVKAPFGSFGPDDADALSEAIQRHRGKTGD